MNDHQKGYFKLLGGILMISPLVYAYIALECGHGSKAFGITVLIYIGMMSIGILMYNYLETGQFVFFPNRFIDSNGKILHSFDGPSPCLYKTDKHMTSLSTLRHNNWWDSGIKNIKTIKAQIEQADSIGLKSIDGIHTLTNSHAIAYFESFGMEVYTRQTMEGSKTRLSWK